MEEWRGRNCIIVGNKTPPYLEKATAHAEHLACTASISRPWYSTESTHHARRNQHRHRNSEFGNQTSRKEEERGENKYLLLLAGILGDGGSGCMYHRRIRTHLNRSNRNNKAAAEGRKNENRSFSWKFETLERERGERMDRLDLCIIFLLRFLLVQVKRSLILSSVFWIFYYFITFYFSPCVYTPGKSVT